MYIKRGYFIITKNKNKKKAKLTMKFVIFQNRMHV